MVTNEVPDRGQTNPVRDGMLKVIGVMKIRNVARVGMIVSSTKIRSYLCPPLVLILGDGDDYYQLPIAKKL